MALKKDKRGKPCSLIPYYDTGEERIWVRVIEQALWDATLGLGCRSKAPVKVDRHFGIPPEEIGRSRRFISGRDGALEPICAALGLDYAVIRDHLVDVYNSCLPAMPTEWREVL